jgi:acyl carrier protein
MTETMTDQSMLRNQIRQVIAEHARLAVEVADLDDRDDLFRAGMSSHASVNVMLALEEAFDVEFPESMLRKSTFESVQAIEAALGELGSVWA